MDFLTKAVLTAIVLIVGGSSLPFTAGTSGFVVIAALAGIWGFDFDGDE